MRVRVRVRVRGEGYRRGLSFEDCVVVAGGEGEGEGEPCAVRRAPCAVRVGVRVGGLAGGEGWEARGGGERLEVDAITHQIEQRRAVPLPMAIAVQEVVAGCR